MAVTPDGQKGWAQYFWEQGYITYLVDTPCRGRSAQLWEPGRKPYLFTADHTERMFTGRGNNDHTQWPAGEDAMGSPVFATFYASMAVSLKYSAYTQQMVRVAGGALLDKIDPAILLTHSQVGAVGWLLADSRSEQVKGVVAVEPVGPPFYDPRTQKQNPASWGLADLPLVYDPPVGPEQLHPQPCPVPEGNHMQGWLQ